MIPLDQQFFRFSLLLLTGVAVGFLFDVYRAYRGVFHPGAVAGSLGDLIFSLAAIALGVGVFLFGTGGELRFYVFLTLFLGLALYFALASRIVLFVHRAAFTLLKKALALIYRTLYLLFIRPLLYFARLLLLPLILLSHLSHLGGNLLRTCGHWDLGLLITSILKKIHPFRRIS
ncbi:MAG: hypothetical protein M1299_10440 [Firmicutes bacterium]|nr:hypothetical protein [Bacillota bacterium]MCL5040221.1 hypothetical protein [Bacillota bacterium]